MKLIRPLTVSFIQSFVSRELASPGISLTSTDAWSLSCITPAFRQKVQIFARGSWLCGYYHVHWIVNTNFQLILFDAQWSPNWVVGKLKNSALYSWTIVIVWTSHCCVVVIIVYFLMLCAVSWSLGFSRAMDHNSWMMNLKPINNVFPSNDFYMHPIHVNTNLIMNIRLI